MLRRLLPGLVLGLPREKECQRATSLEDAVAAAVGSFMALFEDGPGASSPLRHHSAVVRRSGERVSSVPCLPAVSQDSASCTLHLELQPASWQTGRLDDRLQFQMEGAIGAVLGESQ